jgi:hypothetical protein
MIAKRPPRAQASHGWPAKVVYGGWPAYILLRPVEDSLFFGLEFIFGQHALLT